MPTIDEIAYIYNASPTPTVILKAASSQLTIVTANTAFLKSTGKVLSELIGKDFFEAFPMNPDDTGVRTNNVQKAFEHVLKFKESYQIKDHNYNLPSPVDQEFFVRFWKIDTYPLLDPGGEIEYIVQSSEDITYLKEAEERTKLAQQRDFDLFNFSPVPMWAYDTRTLQILAANDAAQKDYGYTLNEFLGLTIEVLWPEEDIPAMMKLVEQKVKKGLHNKAIVRHIKKNGTIIHVDLESQPLPSWGKNTRIIIALDITSIKISNDLESHEKKVLEMNSKSEVRLTEVLAYYVKGIESLFPGMQCTIMQVKHNRIYSWVPSSLPKVFTDKIEGLKIGENEGSCGTAAFLKQTIIVSDINLDPRWTGYRKLALSCNLFACWSQPIINSSGKVMATFAIYYSENKEPNEDELKVIERASALLKIVLENRQYITERTSYIHIMEQQNFRLRDIAWAQTHLVRAPLARILGIVELLEVSPPELVDKKLLHYLHISAKELDKVIKGIIDKSLS